MQTEAEQLVAYCGRYCGTCGICGFNIGAGIAAVNSVVEAAAFRREAEHLGWPVMRDLATHCCAHFEDEVKSFAELAPKLFPSNCRGGCVPPCQIVKCCRAKGHTTCADCGDLDACPKIADVVKKRPELEANLKDIAREGITRWAERQYAAAREARTRSFTEAIDRAFE